MPEGWIFFKLSPMHTNKQNNHINLLGYSINSNNPAACC